MTKVPQSPTVPYLDVSIPFHYVEPDDAELIKKLKIFVESIHPRHPVLA